MRKEYVVIPPKVFWKYYDLYRRKQISLEEFSRLSGLKTYEICSYLDAI